MSTKRHMARVSVASLVVLGMVAAPLAAEPPPFTNVSVTPTCEGWLITCDPLPGAVVYQASLWYCGPSPWETNPIALWSSSTPELLIPMPVGQWTGQIFLNAFGADWGCAVWDCYLATAFGDLGNVGVPRVAEPLPSQLALGWGATVELKVVATGPDLTYDWRRNGAPLQSGPSPVLLAPSDQFQPGDVVSVTVANDCGEASGGATSFGTDEATPWTLGALLSLDSRSEYECAWSIAVCSHQGQCWSDAWSPPTSSVQRSAGRSDWQGLSYRAGIGDSLSVGQSASVDVEPNRVTYTFQSSFPPACGAPLPGTATFSSTATFKIDSPEVALRIKGLGSMYGFPTWFAVKVVDQGGQTVVSVADDQTGQFSPDVTVAVPPGAYLLSVAGSGGAWGFGQAWITAALVSTADCNGDGIADWITIEDGTTSDFDQSGIPDVCEYLLVPEEFSTIGAALAAAVDGDRISVAPGTYAEHLSLAGKDVELIGRNEGVYIDGLGTPGTLLTIGPGVGESTVVRNLTFRNSADGSPLPEAPQYIVGGAILVDDASPRVDQCRFEGNHSSMFGGAVYTRFSSATFDHCDFNGNTAGYDGGGIQAITSAIDLIGCTFTGNVSSGYGGAAHLALGAPFGDNTMEVAGCTFTGNTGQTGGGIRFHTTGPDRRLVVTGSVFSGNTAADGGAVWAAPSVPGAMSLGTSAICENTWPQIVASAYADLGGNTFCACTADYNEDGLVGAADLSILLGYWGPLPPTSPPGIDLDGNSMIDAADLSVLLGAWGPCP